MWYDRYFSLGTKKMLASQRAKNERVLVLVDGENFSAKNYSAFEDWLGKDFQNDCTSTSVRKIVVTNEHDHSWNSISNEYDLELTRVSPVIKGKNHVDIAIIVKAIKAACTQVASDIYILSSDCDFCQAGDALREMGVKSTLVVSTASYNPGIKSHFDRVIDLFNLCPNDSQLRLFEDQLKDVDEILFGLLADPADKIKAVLDSMLKINCVNSWVNVNSLTGRLRCSYELLDKIDQKKAKDELLKFFKDHSEKYELLEGENKKLTRVRCRSADGRSLCPTPSDALNRLGDERIYSHILKCIRRSQKSAAAGGTIDYSIGLIIDRLVQSLMGRFGLDIFEGKELKSALVKRLKNRPSIRIDSQRVFISDPQQKEVA